MRNSVHTLDILKSLGFIYHLDEASRDEPFIVPVKGGDFVTVPYTFHMNDIVSFPFTGWNPAAYEQALRDEFDQLYEEGATRRRMMVISLHDRISGHANRVRVLDRFLTYARSRPGVWFARKDEIAEWALKPAARPRCWIAAPPASVACRGGRRSGARARVPSRHATVSRRISSLDWRLCGKGLSNVGRIEMSDRRPIKLPEKNHPDDKVRTVIEAAVSVIPGGSGIAKLMGDLARSSSQKARGKWEQAVSERTNENTDRLDHHDDSSDPRTT